MVAQVDIEGYGQGFHGHLRPRDGHQTVGVWIQEVFHRRLVLARLCHSCGKLMVYEYVSRSLLV